MIDSQLNGFKEFFAHTSTKISIEVLIPKFKVWFIPIILKNHELFLNNNNYYSRRFKTGTN